MPQGIVEMHRCSAAGISNAMIRSFLIIVFMMISLLTAFHPASAGPGRNCGQRERPYGGYCQGPRWGWYGARNPVNSPDEAQKLLARFFEGEDVVIGPVKERELIFEAEIRDKKNNVIDRVIVHKRTGRIRSIY